MVVVPTDGEEVNKELEQPTETDVRLLFDDMKKPMEALQRVFNYALEELSKSGVEVDNHASLKIERNELTVTLGDYFYWYRVSESVNKIR